STSRPGSERRGGSSRLPISRGSPHFESGDDAGRPLVRVRHRAQSDGPISRHRFAIVLLYGRPRVSAVVVTLNESARRRRTIDSLWTYGTTLVENVSSTRVAGIEVLINLCSRCPACAMLCQSNATGRLPDDDRGNA